MSRFMRNARSVFARIGIISFPLCVSLGAAVPLPTVPTVSDAPSYVQDVFKNFKDGYPKSQKKLSAPKKGKTNKQLIRIGLIGAGPSGLSLLNAFNKELERLNINDEDINFELVCFEKQPQIGGLWNYDWRVGTDKYGLPIHASQYRHLWSNGPKECLEMSDYTFDTHFNGNNLGSFPPRPVLEHYIMGRVKTNQLESKFDIRLNHHIIDVKQSADDKFELIYHDLVNDIHGSQEFDYVVVASGHFSIPNMVDFKGFDTFTGRIIHAHSFRNAQEFKGQNVLMIGSSYSAEDISLQIWKFGAKNVTISYRTAPMGFKWPNGIREVPLLKEIRNGKDAVFSNGEVVEDIDSIILCTGYIHSFPFLSDKHRLKTDNVLYPPGLYKGVVWVDQPNLFYIGMQDQWYTFTMFDMQSLYIKDVILDKIELPNKPLMINEAAEWNNKGKTRITDAEHIHFQTDYIIDLYNNLSNPNEYIDDANKLDYSSEFLQWEHDKHSDILTYRDKCFESKVSGNIASKFNTPWTEAFDDSIENFLGYNPDK